MSYLCLTAVHHHRISHLLGRWFGRSISRGAAAIDGAVKEESCAIARYPMSTSATSKPRARLGILYQSTRVCQHRSRGTLSLKGTLEKIVVLVLDLIFDGRDHAREVIKRSMLVSF